MVAGITDYKGEIIKRLTRCTSTGVAQHEIFEDWTDVVYASLKALPRHVKSAVETGKPAEDDEETRAIWKRINNRYKGHSEYAIQTVWEYFSQAFALLIDSASSGLDVVGDVYMEIGWPNKWAGQYFTPMPVADMMAAVTMSGIEKEIIARMTEAAKNDPLAGAIALAGMIPQDPNEAYEYFLNRVLPSVAPLVKPIAVSDPCCGSGVMFIAASKQIPRWALDWGLVRFYGQDLDATCVKMAQINMMLYGLNGYRIQCALAMSEAELINVPEPWRGKYREAREDPGKVAEIEAELRSWKQPVLL